LLRTRMSVITFENVISAIRAATTEELLEFSLLLNPVQKKAVAKKAVAKQEKPIVPMPETDDGSAPDASVYRVDEADIDHSVCVGREMDTDKRWKPFINKERQCGSKLVDGSDLCKKCTTREEKYAKKEGPGPWLGRVTEEPLDWTHMLGTAWAEEAKPKFKGSGSGSGSVASDAASEEMEPVEKPKKEDKKAKKEAEAAAKKEAKEAEKEAKKAKAKKEPKPKKAAVDPMNTIETMLRRMGAGSTDEKRKQFSLMLKKVAAELEDATKANIEMIGDDLYETHNGNVYEWNTVTEKRGDFVGRLMGAKGDYSIDTDGAEVEA